MSIYGQEDCSWKSHHPEHIPIIKVELRKDLLMRNGQ